MKIKDVMPISTPESKHIAENLQKARKKCGYSYQQLADKTGLSKSTLQRYESGAIQSLSLGKAEQLAQALNITPAELLGWQDLNGSKTFEGAVLEILSYLGYEVETTDMDPDTEFACLSSGCQLVDDGESERYWIRNREDNVWREVSIEKILTLFAEVKEYAEFAVHRAMKDSNIIERPEPWYHLDKFFKE